MAASGADAGLQALLEARFTAAVAAGLTRTKDLTKTRKALLGPPPGAHRAVDHGSVEWVRGSLTAQFNEEHIAAKRKTPMQTAAAAPPVLKPFDERAFHFGKADPREVLCSVTAGAGVGVAVSVDALGGLLTASPDTLWAGPHPVLVNASPLCSPHALIVPRAGARLPQALLPGAVRLALDVAASPGAEGLRVAFNSPGAWASVNHLHLHVVPAAFADGATEQLCMPVEASPVTPLAVAALRGAEGEPRVTVGSLELWPAWGLSFEASEPTGPCLEALSRAVSGVVAALQADDVAHNMLVADRGRRVVLFPRRKQARTGDGTVNVAVMEICGRGIVNEEEGWSPLTAASLAAQLAEVRLDAGALASIAATAVAEVKALA